MIIKYMIFSYLNISFFHKVKYFGFFYSIKNLKNLVINHEKVKKKKRSKLLLTKSQKSKRHLSLSYIRYLSNPSSSIRKSIFNFNNLFPNMIIR